MLSKEINDPDEFIRFSYIPVILNKRRYQENLRSSMVFHPLCRYLRMRIDRLSKNIQRNALKHYIPMRQLVSVTPAAESSPCTQMTRRQTVAVLGCGAIGLLYGSILSRSPERDVHFLLRGDYDRIMHTGVEIQQHDGNIIRLHDRSRFHKEVGTILPYLRNEKGNDVDGNQYKGVDWILVCLKSPALISEGKKEYNQDIKSKMTPLVGKNTRIMVMMNGLNTENPFKAWFKDLNIFGVMCFVCANRIQDNSKTIDKESPLIVKHIAHGNLHIGHVRDDKSELDFARSLWQNTWLEDKITTAPSLLSARWSKLFWNLPFNGIAISMGGISTDVIATSPELRDYADKVLNDVIKLANADLTLQGYDDSLMYKGEKEMEIKRFIWSLTDEMGPYKTSTVLDLISNADLEIEFMFRQPYVRLKEVQKETNETFPYLESLLLSVIGFNRALYQGIVKKNGGKWTSNCLKST